MEASPSSVLSFVMYQRSSYMADGPQFSSVQFHFKIPLHTKKLLKIQCNKLNDKLQQGQKIDDKFYIRVHRILYGGEFLKEELSQ